MVGLLDISPLAETVKIDEQDIDVPGVSAEGIVVLVRRFPELRSLLDGNIGSEKLLGMGTAIVAAIIAAGCGYPGNEQAETIAARYNIAAQVDLLEAILRRTLPKGVGPFVEKLGKLTDQLNPSDDPGIIKLRLRASPKPSKSLSENADIRRTMSGE